jgi:hypothetical protein
VQCRQGWGVERRGCSWEVGGRNLVEGGAVVWLEVRWWGAEVLVEVEWLSAEVLVDVEW